MHQKAEQSEVYQQGNCNEIEIWQKYSIRYLEEAKQVAEYRSKLSYSKEQG